MWLGHIRIALWVSGSSGSTGSYDLLLAINGSRCASSMYYAGSQMHIAIHA